mmetsp:Transcript_94297/g.196856  ORF Transcript_94297/g.196856 Transcript_94297/m.196856 type:complete len:392 (-) Transcript_94297:358-1533(-)
MPEETMSLATAVGISPSRWSPSSVVVRGTQLCRQDRKIQRVQSWQTRNKVLQRLPCISSLNCRQFLTATRALSPRRQRQRQSPEAIVGAMLPTFPATSCCTSSTRASASTSCITASTCWRLFPPTNSPSWTIWTSPCGCWHEGLASKASIWLSSKPRLEGSSPNCHTTTALATTLASLSLPTMLMLAVAPALPRRTLWMLPLAAIWSPPQPLSPHHHLTTRSSTTTTILASSRGPPLSKPQSVCSASSKASPVRPKPKPIGRRQTMTSAETAATAAPPGSPRRWCRTSTLEWALRSGSEVLPSSPSLMYSPLTLLWRQRTHGLVRCRLDISNMDSMQKGTSPGLHCPCLRKVQTSHLTSISHVLRTSLLPSLSFCHHHFCSLHLRCRQPIQ